MNYAEIEEKVRHILADKLDISFEKIQPSSLLRDDLGMDSLGAIEIIYEMEDAFSIKVEEVDMQNIKTVSDISAYAETKMKQTP